MPHLRPSLAFALLASAAVALGVPAAHAAPEAGAAAAGTANPADQNDFRQQEIDLKNQIRANPNDPAPHVKLGQLYIKAGNFPAAEAEAREASRAGADEDDVAPILAEALLNQTKLSQLLDQVKPADRDPAAESTVRFSLGMAHLALGERDQAEPLLRDAVRLDPDAWRPKIGLARLLIMNRDLDNAAKLIDAAQAIEPDQIEIMRTQAEWKRAKGDNDGAIAEFTKILAKRPTDFAALTGRANTLISEAKLDDAQRDIDAALKITPKSPTALYLDALILARQGKLSEADDKLTAISAVFDKMISGYYLAGAVKYALGQYELADQDLAKYLAQQPNQPAARRLRALIALRRNSPQDAIDLLKPVADANPNDAGSIAVLSRAYVMAGKNDDALALYEHAAAGDPGDVKIQTAAALMQMNFGDSTEGTAELEKIAGSDKGTDVAGPLLIMAELRRGEVDKATQEVDALVKRDPDDPVVQNLKGSVEIAGEHLPDAQQTFETLVKTHPNFAAARRNLAQVLLALNKPDEAHAVLAALLEKNPNDERTLMTLAQLAMVRSDTADAADRLAAAQTAAPKDPLPGIRLVQLYAGQKDWDKAGQAMRSLQASFPEDNRVLELAADLRADQGDTVGAVSGYQDLMKRLPESAPIYLRLAALQNRAGQKEAARASLATALSLAPKNRQYMLDLVLFDAAQSPDAGLATARSVAKDDPEAAALLSAEVLLRAKRIDDAIATLSGEQKQRPTSAIAARLGELLYVDGKQADVRALLGGWIKGHDNDVPGRLALADIDMHEKNDAEARVLYEAIQKLAPQNVIALNNLAVLYARAKDPRAATLAADAYRRDPGPQTGDTLGWILATTGKPDEGVAYLRNASAAQPQSGAIQYHLAAALITLGKKDEARTILEQVMKSDRPFDEKADAQHLLETLQHG